MSDRKDNFTPENGFDLEHILAEVSGYSDSKEPPKASEKRPESKSDAPTQKSESEAEATRSFPPLFSKRGRKPHQPPQKTPSDSEHKVVHFPSSFSEEEEENDEEDELDDEDMKPYPPPPSNENEATKVIHFPGRPMTPEEEALYALEKKLERIKKKADDFADQMFSEEGVEVSEHTLRLEKLIPAVDEEEAPPPKPEKKEKKERKPRPAPQLPPDRAPEELYQLYSKKRQPLHLRWMACVVLALVQIVVLLLPQLPVVLPAPFDQMATLSYLSAALLAVSAALSTDVWAMGLWNLCRGKPGMDTLLGFSVLATLTDAITMPRLAPRDGYLPYCAVVAVALAFALRGMYLKYSALRLNCRTAAAASEPYLVTLDQDKWNSKAAYTKHRGTIHGFGSQIQTEDGAQRIYRLAAPLLILACFLLSVLASVGKEQPEYLPWCLSATLNAAIGFGALLAYAKPYHRLTRRLASSGAALAGWDGIAEPGRSILLSDIDLFPQGTVAVNGIKIFGDFSIEKVVAVTASVIRESGSGLDTVFHDLLRAKGALYRRCEDFTRYEGGGASAIIRSQEIYVGSAAFMALMDVALPQGLNVKHAVFCAIDGELAGIFALNYSLHPSVPPALHALIQNRVAPVLATRDFNLIPTMLRQRFKLPVEKIEFPSVERRVELSDPRQSHNDILTAVLCREGVSPLSEAIVGAGRLRSATRLSCLLTCIGAGLGVLLTFYLTMNLSFFALSPLNLLIFQLMWLVPVYLISGWVNQY